METISLTARIASLARPMRPGRLFLILGETLSLWVDRRRQRRMLTALSNDMLRDIGISRVEVEQEIHKPFWRQ